MTIAVITSLYGDLDVLKDPPVMDGVDDYIAVTDRQRDVGLWRQVIEPRRHLSNRLCSKIPKCLPHLYTNADYVVWIDASATVRKDAAQWAVEQMRDGFLSQFVHPERNCLGDEAKVSAGLKKYQGLMVEEQAADYFKAGMPRNWGLWATGIMAQCSVPWLHKIGEDWLTEQVRWSYQDQVSQPYVLWQYGLRPQALDGSLWHDPHIQFGGHATDD